MLLHALEQIEFIKNEITTQDNTYNITTTPNRLTVQCLVAPSAGGEQSETVDEIYTLYFFEKIDVDFYDEVVVRGKVGVVDGVPRLWYAPTGRRVKGLEVRVRIIANEAYNAGTV